MKANLNYLNSNKFSTQKKPHLRNGEAELKSRENTNMIRPAQAISFGGSALSVSEKFVKNITTNKLINFVSENEAAYSAIYSLVIAGMLKPMVVLAQTGHDDKDGQMIATKNFIQAFLGSFLGLTVGGGFVKKIWDNIKDNLKVYDIDEAGKVLSYKNEAHKDIQDIAKKLVKREHNTLGDKFAQAKEMFSDSHGFRKVTSFIRGLRSNINYKPTDEEISSRAKVFLENFHKNHKGIFEKNTDFLKELVSDMKQLELNPKSAKENLKEGFKSTKFGAFESFWKNSTGAATSIFKAKIASFLLPTVMAFLFAKRNLETKAKKDAEISQKTSSTLVNNSKGFKELQEKFSNITGTGEQQKTNVSPSFKGALDVAIEKSTRAIERAAVSSPGEKCVNALAKFKKPSARMADLESIGITTYWVGSTAMSKRIDPDQKLGLNVHSILVTAISSTAALIVDTLTDGFLDRAESSYLDVLKDTAKSAAEKLKEGADMEEIKKFVKKNTGNMFNSKELVDKIANKETLNLDAKKLNSALENLACTYGQKLSKLKTLTIFTLVVRFLVPVLTVKMSKKIKNKIIDWTKQRRAEKENQAKAAQKTQTAQQTQQAK